MPPALVLCAGLGKRLDPLTRIVAKPAVPFGGRTLIERILEWLVRQGVRDVVLNLHHLPETITGVVGDGAHLRLRVRYSWEREILGSAGGPRHALPLLESPTVLIVNGDTLCDIDLRPLIDAHIATGAEATMAVVRNPAPDRYNGVVVDADGIVRGVRPKGHDEQTWHFVGIQVVQASLFAGLADGVPEETVAGLYRGRISAGLGQVRAWRVEAPFLDVGTPRDYLDSVLAMGGMRPDGSVVEDGAVVDASAAVRASVVWPGARIAADVGLRECVVAAGAVLPEGYQATRAVLVPASLVRPDDRAEVTNGVAAFPL